MAHYVGKINFASFVDMTIAEVEYDDEVKKCICIPIKDNNIQQWHDEWQMWFRAVRHSTEGHSFSHFIMRYIPYNDIKRMTHNQLEMMSRHSIGAMKKSTGSEQ